MSHLPLAPGYCVGTSYEPQGLFPLPSGTYDVLVIVGGGDENTTGVLRLRDAAVGSDPSAPNLLVFSQLGEPGLQARQRMVIASDITLAVYLSATRSNQNDNGGSAMADAIALIEIE